MEEDGGEEGGNKALYFPTQELGLKRDSDVDEKVGTEERAVVQSIVKAIEQKASAKQVRLRTSVEDGCRHPER